jgi:cytochrome c-type protein NapC
MNKLIKKIITNWKTVILGLAFLFIFSFSFSISGAYVLAHTSTEEFCVSCHEMSYNFEEYKATIHNSNRTGVRATCTDCHVPHEPLPLVWAKIKATKDLYYTYISPSIETREKFEAKRAHMAQNIWIEMKENDSANCRSCHKEDKMDPNLQSEKTKVRHAKGKKEGITCIECHFAIAHKEPEGLGPSELFQSMAVKPK